MKKNEEKAVVIGKALFLNFDNFVDWCSTDEADDFFKTENLWKNHLYELQGKIPGVNISNLFDKTSKKNCYGYINDNREKEYITPLKQYVDYISNYSSSTNPLYFYLIYECPHFDIIAFANAQFLIPSGFLNKTLFKDYSNFPIGFIRNEINASAIHGMNNGLVSVTPGLAGISLNSQKSYIESKKNELDVLKAEMDDVKHARKGELADLQAEIDKQVAALEAKKSELLSILAAKKAKLDIEKERLERELFVLESEIYSIRCYLGEVVDFIKLRSGKPAATDFPITLFQKIRFLDEELGKAISFYDFDFGDTKLFEDLLKAREDIFEVFCPNEKCVSLVRVSKKGTAFGYRDTPYGNMLIEYEVYHGDKIGILIRNGENLFFGWTDEEKIKLSEDMFFAPGSKTIINEEDANQIETTSIHEAVSRYFVFSILQGALENGEMLSLPDNIKAVFTKPSPYILYSVADAWITDNKYGSFRDIIEKANSKISVGDSILALLSLSDGKTSYGWGGGYSRNYNRDHNFSRRTHDVSFKDGQIYKINLIEGAEDDKEYYVSLVKNNYMDYVWRNGRYEERLRDAYARFRVYEDEFINLTYMNSAWLKYIITTRNLGDYGRMGSYAEMIRYLNKALDFVKKREEQERQLIAKHFLSIDEVLDWPAQLSEWKLSANVRNITDYQAKRFAKFLRRHI